MAIEKKFFGTIRGENVDEYTLSRGNLSVKILNYGGIIRVFQVKTAKGEYDIALGYDTAAEYENSGTYFGSIIGRVANRIANGKFTLNGKEYVLFPNNGVNTLHGGKEGFHRKFWKAEIAGEYALKLSYSSKDGEENFPAGLNVSVVYSLTERNGLKIEYSAVSDGDTPVSLTNHSYFNLNGEGSGDVLGHKLQILADKITPVDAKLIPTGEFMDVKNTPFDFNAPKKIGEDINADHEQIKHCGGYDINFVKAAAGFSLVACAEGDLSGIIMRVYSTEDGVQLYTGNFLNGVKGKSGVYGRRSAFCLETQAFPNAVNCKAFPSVILRAGEKYQSATEYVIEV